MKAVNFETLTRKFESLSSSDKRALIILSLFLTVTLMYFITGQSFRYRSEKIADVEAKRSLIVLLNSSEKKIAAAKNKPKLEGLDQALLTLVSSTARGYQITFKRFQPDGDKVLKLWMEHVDFNSLLIWLGEIDKKNGISVQEISVEQAKDEGYVDVRLTLER